METRDNERLQNNLSCTRDNDLEVRVMIFMKATLFYTLTTSDSRADNDSFVMTDKTTPTTIKTWKKPRRKSD